MRYQYVLGINRWTKPCTLNYTHLWLYAMKYVTFTFLAQFFLNCNCNIYPCNQDFHIFKEHMPLGMENGFFVYKRLRDLSVYYCDLSISVILIQKLRQNSWNLDVKSFEHRFSKIQVSSTKKKFRRLKRWCIASDELSFCKI